MIVAGVLMSELKGSAAQRGEDVGAAAQATEA
jgi:hypothetical protein